MIREGGAQSVFYNRVYEPWRIKRDQQVEATLVAAGVQVRSFNSLLLYEPWDAKVRMLWCFISKPCVDSVEAKVEA